MKLITKYGLTILSFLVLFLSIANILKNLDNLFSLTVLLSIIGIFGFSLHLTKHKLHKTVYLLWIAAQLPIITTKNIDTNQLGTIFDLSQTFTLNYGFGLIYNPISYRIGINIIPVIYLVLYKVLEKNNGFTQNEINIKLNIQVFFIFLISLISIVFFNIKEDENPFNYTENNINLPDGNTVQAIGFSEIKLNNKNTYKVVNYYSQNVINDSECRKCKNEAITLANFIAKKNNKLPDTLMMKAHGIRTGKIFKTQQKYNTIVYNNGSKWILLDE